MIYNDLYSAYSEVMSNTKILFRAKLHKNVIFLVIIMSLVIVIPAIMIKMSFNHNLITQVRLLITLGITMTIVLALSLVIFVNHYILKVTIKMFETIRFNEQEQKNSNLAVEKIRYSMVLEILGEKSKDLEYIQYLTSQSKDFIEISKSDRFSLKDLGVPATILIILNYYFSAVYKKFEELDIYSITLWTLLYLALTIFIVFLYYTVKNIYTIFTTNEHDRHKDLLLILKKIESSIIAGKSNYLIY